MISRRGVFVGLGATAAAALGWEWFGGSEQQAIVAVIRKRLDYLKIADADLLAFADDLIAHRVVDSVKLRMLDGLATMYRQLPLGGKASWLHDLHHGEERIVSLFLLSSDFFRNGADESKPVAYLKYYEPAEQPCSNPFARFQADADG